MLKKQRLYKFYQQIYQKSTEFAVKIKIYPVKLYSVSTNGISDLGIIWRSAENLLFGSDCGESWCFENLQK